MIVTVLLGLLSGRGWIRVPLPPKIDWNSSGSRTSSILIVLGAPWNFTESLLHSFFSLQGTVNHTCLVNKAIEAHRSNIFFSCSFRFLSSAFVLPDAAGAGVEEEASAGAAASFVFRARFAGGGCEAACSSSCQSAHPTMSDASSTCIEGAKTHLDDSLLHRRNNSGTNRAIRVYGVDVELICQATSAVSSRSRAERAK